MNKKLTTERINSLLNQFNSDGFNDATDAELMAALRELQERRKAAAEPVAWTDEQELRDVEKLGCGYLFTVNPITPNADPRRVIKLYRLPEVD